MGIDYSYEIFAPCDSTVQLVQSLAVHLLPSDADRLLSAVGEDPARLIECVRRIDCEVYPGCDLFCLSFLFAPDDWVIEYGESHRCLSDPSTGRVRIGCVWSSLQCGERFMLFRGTAATNDMSLLFKSSPNIRSTFTKIAQDAGAWLVAFDDESGDLLQVWPQKQPVRVCVPDSEYRVGIDLYCERALQMFGVIPDEPTQDNEPAAIVSDTMTISKNEITEEIKKLLLQENRAKAVILVRQKLGLGLRRALEVVNEIEDEYLLNQLICEEDARMTSEVVAIGIFKKDIVPYLEYPEDYYRTVKEGIKIMTFICQGLGRSRSYSLAKCLGIDVWDFNQHEIDISKINVECVKAEFGNDVIDAIDALHRAGFSFFFCPQG